MLLLASATNRFVAVFIKLSRLSSYPGKESDVDLCRPDRRAASGEPTALNGAEGASISNGRGFNAQVYFTPVTLHK